MIGMVEWTCVQCGAKQCMRRDVQLVLQQSSQEFFCLFGHGQHYPQGPTEAEKLRKALESERRQRERAEQSVAMWRDDARAAGERADHERRRANGYKGQAVKLARRAQGGACPCCNRHFVLLAQHMATKHPGFSTDVANADVDLNPKNEAPLVHLDALT